MKTAFFSLTHEGIFTWVSKDCNLVNGFVPSELIGHPFIEFVAPEELFDMLINRKNRTTGRTAEYFTYILTKDGARKRAVLKVLDTPENTVGNVTVLDEK